MSIYDLQDHLRSPWTLVVVLLLGNLILTIILFSKLFRRNPPGLMWRTFTDDRGVPDFNRISAFLGIVMLVLITTVALIWPTRSLSDAYVVGWFGIVGAAVAGVAVATHSYYKAGGSTAPPEETDGADGDYNQQGNGTL